MGSKRGVLGYTRVRRRWVYIRCQQWNLFVGERHVSQNNVLQTASFLRAGSGDRHGECVDAQMMELGDEDDEDEAG